MVGAVIVHVPWLGVAVRMVLVAPDRVVAVVTPVASMGPLLVAVAV